MTERCSSSHVVEREEILFGVLTGEVRKEKRQFEVVLEIEKSYTWLPDLGMGNIYSTILHSTVARVTSGYASTHSDGPSFHRNPCSSSH
jgi:hypothetical protein